MSCTKIFNNAYIKKPNSYIIAKLIIDNESQVVLFPKILRHNYFHRITSKPVLQIIQNISDFGTIVRCLDDEVELFEFCHKNNLTLKDPIYQKKLEEYRLKYQEDKTTYLEDS